MGRHPRMALVCLLFIGNILFLLSTAASANSIRVLVDSPTPSIGLLDSGVPNDLDSATEEPTFIQASAPRWAPSLSSISQFGREPITKCKTSLCPPVPAPCGPVCILPQRRWGQWELAVQAFYARIRGTLKWTDPFVGPHPSVDFNDGIGLPNHKWLMEYSARYQFRPHWSCFYSIMPIEVEETYVNPSLPGQTFRSKWEHVYQRVGIMYQPIVTCNASVSVFGTWMFMDQKFRLNSSSHCALNRAKTVDRTRHMVMTGLEVQKCIRTLCNGGTLSCDNRIGLAFLDGTFGYDLQAGFRFSVPMNSGRWGFARGGYRLIQFQEDRDDLRMDHTLEGWFGELGLIF